MVDRKRILFVDDERNILQGLQDLLRKQRKEWDMAFALGSQAALDELAQAPFDVVVSDMRMPGMDGAELLARIKEQYPSVARIVLSGHADRDAIESTPDTTTPDRGCPAWRSTRAATDASV